MPIPRVENAPEHPVTDGGLQFTGAVTIQDRRLNPIFLEQLRLSPCFKQAMFRAKNRQPAGLFVLTCQPLLRH